MTDAPSGNQPPTLLPCPFCGGGETLVDEQKFWTGMSSQVISAVVRHWCPKSPLSSIIELKAKAVEEAVALWNRRVPAGGGAPVAWRVIFKESRPGHDLPRVEFTQVRPAAMEREPDRFEVTPLYASPSDVAPPRLPTFDASKVVRAQRSLDQFKPPEVGAVWTEGHGNDFGCLVSDCTEALIETITEAHLK